MRGAILVLNAGSSSIKFSLFAAAAWPRRKDLLCHGAMAGIGGGVHFFATDAAGRVTAEQQLGEGTDHEAALEVLLRWLEEHFGEPALAAVGHRVVHGGRRYAAPVRVDAVVAAELRRLVPLAPLHQPHHLAAIDAITKLHPALPQIACFDTAFHHSQPAVAAAFALPRQLAAEGVRRYGFHGLSYEYIASVLPEFLGPEAAEGRVVVAHLGAGASMCAMRGRKSVATTMGFTALDGLMMAQRCGALDPGVILYLLQQKGMAADAVADLLYHQSGLKGVSGISDDMRTLLASPDPRAAEAIDLFVYRIGRELGSLAAALGGLDALVFTAGIGEHAAQIRARVCDDAGWFGVAFDPAANAAGGPRLTRPGSTVSAWVIPTDEDLMIARHVWRLLDAPGARN
jgi:acetate kinase